MAAVGQLSIVSNSQDVKDKEIGRRKRKKKEKVRQVIRVQKTSGLSVDCRPVL
jgi:hypothetical protein